MYSFLLVEGKKTVCLLKKHFIGHKGTDNQSVSVAFLCFFCTTFTAPCFSLQYCATEFAFIGVKGLSALRS